MEDCGGRRPKSGTHVFTAGLDYRRNGTPTADEKWPIPEQVHLIEWVGALNTFVLICSSVTLVKGLSAIQHGDAAALQRFLILTILGGVTFLSLQAYEWTHNIERGIHPGAVGFIVVVVGIIGHGLPPLVGT